MKQILSAGVIGLAFLAFTNVASAQSHGGRHYGGGSYVEPRYSQYGSTPRYYDPYANSGPSFSFSTPSFGLGVYSTPSYGPGISIYSGSNYGQSYLSPYSGGFGPYQSHRHHDHHRHHHGHHHHHHHHR